MTPLVLVPGMMCDARLFLPQLVAFSRERPVSVVPLIGRDSIEALARDALSNAPARFALAGLSMGGIVAMEIARLAPERIDRLALMDTNHLPEQPERQALREDEISEALAGGLTRVMREEMKPNYLAEGPRKAAILRTCMDMAMDLGPEVFAHQSRALRDREDQSETLRGLACPTLILCGRHDLLCPVERHEAMQALVPSCVIDVIEDAGHMPTLEQPGATNAALARWLNAPSTA
ncbi:MAG: alpha/beta fold hydrolase [Pseudomonadota bacterium]